MTTLAIILMIIRWQFDDKSCSGDLTILKARHINRWPRRLEERLAVKVGDGGKWEELGKHTSALALRHTPPAGCQASLIALGLT